MPKWRHAAWLSCAALALAGCATTGSTAASSIKAKGDTLTVYASQPPGGSGGQEATDMLDAEQLALRQEGGKAGKFAVRLIKLDGHVLSDNARTAIEDQSSIAYLGELQPGTSQISVPINNQLGLLQVSPLDTAIYLTQPVAAPVSSSPSTFYPSRSSYRQTFARMVGTSAVEAKKIVAEMRVQGVSRLFVTDDGALYGASLAEAVRRDAVATGLTLVGAAASANGIFFGASLVSPTARTGATRALDRFAAINPGAKLFAPSGLYDDSFVAGLSAGAARRLYVSSPGFDARNLPPAGQTYMTEFERAFGHQPVPQAIFGYEAMSALLYVLRQAGSQADDRSTVVADFRGLRNPPNSVIGPYSINDGDPTISPFIFARVRDGKLTPFAFVGS
jgi:branched-chain amino acid transport system substrate-binding protein